MSLIRDMQSALSAELGQGFLFAPVVFGMGILLFFQMGAEPRAALVWASFLVGCLSLGSGLITRI
jgi:competence protein ComEC